MSGTRRYEGRDLPRPHEEVVDQGLAFDLGTMTGRRGLLRGLGLGAVVLGAAACGAGPSTGSAPATADPSTGLVEIPDETAGPFPGDGSNGPDVLARRGVVRSDIRSSFGGPTGVATGVPMTLVLRVLDIAGGGAPYAGVAVYVWHCDRAGAYSMYSEAAAGENYLRGVQVAGGDGTVRFTSVVPACYSGRWPHVHFEVYPDLASTADHERCLATSQVALPKDMCDRVYAQPGYESSPATFAGVTLDGDGVFGDDAGIRQLGTVTGDVGAGYTVALTAPVDRRTAPRDAGPP